MTESPRYSRWQCSRSNCEATVYPDETYTQFDPRFTTGWCENHSYRKDPKTGKPVPSSKKSITLVRQIIQ